MVLFSGHAMTSSQKHSKKLYKNAKIWLEVKTNPFLCKKVENIKITNLEFVLETTT